MEAMVDLPDPEAPTRAMLVWGGSLRLRVLRTGPSGRDGYVKLMSSKEMVPSAGRRT